MPRGQRISLEDKIARIDKDIEEMNDRAQNIQNKIKALVEQRNELLEEIQSQKLLRIADILSRSGRTPEELEDLLQNIS